MKGSFFFLVILFFSDVTLAQEQVIRKSADRAYENFSYSEALSKYHILNQKDSNNLHYINRLGDTYLKLNDSKNAEIWLCKLIEKHDGFDNRKLFEYAQVLSKNKKYDQAKYWYDQYRDRGGLAITGEKIDGIEKIESFFAEVGKYSIEYLEFNTNKSDFSPFYYKNGIAFVSSRKEKEWVKDTYTWDQSDYLDFYYFNPNDTSKHLEKVEGLNSKYHEGPAHVYDFGNKIVFTRNGVEERKLQRNAEGIAKLQLYFGEKAEDGWHITPYVHNTIVSSFGHPTISSDEQLLIFASDMPGGFGGTDLYFSKKDRSENWSIPANLGESVNTSEAEMFPYISGNRLWFASDGREGLGGLDIYWIQFDDQKVSGKAVNVGAPINSNQDDFGLITTGNFRKGYFTSDRKGSDDIYSYITEFVNVNGKVLAKGSELPIPEAKVTLMDNNGNIITTLMTNDEGVYSLEIGKDATFSISAEKSNFILDQTVIESTKNMANVKKLKPVYLLQRLMDIYAIEAESKDTLSDVVQTVKIIDVKGVIAPVEGKSNHFIVEPNAYEIVTAKEGYYTLRDTVSITNDFYGLKEYTAELKKIVVGESIRLDHIYYDVNSANLRHESELELDKVVVFMLDNPHIKIELSSHTDSRGSAPYNQRLSQLRAESATNYLVVQGIDAERIVPKGYGEGKIVNRCKDGVRCSAEEHQENRRTEIKILKNE